MGRLVSMLAIGCSLWATGHAQSALRNAPPPQLIDIDLVRADLRDVLRLLAEVGQVNLVFGEGVSGKVTLKLKRVRWQDALQTVLASHGLATERRGNILLVASAQQLYEQREQKLSEREQCVRNAPLRTRIIRVSYARASSLVAHVRQTLSERGSVQVDPRTNSLIVRDVDCPAAQPPD